MRTMPHFLVLCSGSMLLAGCMPKGPEGLDSPLPQERMEAAVQAADRDDESSVPGLVVMLDSDDPAVRMVAIHSLERITGQTFGYDFSADEADRAPAVARWRQYAQEHRTDAHDSVPSRTGGGAQ